MSIEPLAKLSERRRALNHKNNLHKALLRIIQNHRTGADMLHKIQVSAGGNVVDICPEDLPALENIIQSQHDALTEKLKSLDEVAMLATNLAKDI